MLSASTKASNAPTFQGVNGGDCLRSAAVLSGCRTVPSSSQAAPLPLPPPLPLPLPLPPPSPGDQAALLTWMSCRTTAMPPPSPARWRQMASIDGAPTYSAPGPMTPRKLRV